MDVKSLYTVIPNTDGLSALKHFLDQRPTQNPPTTTLLRLAELVLTTNGFSFDGKYYVQVGGVAMGSKLGPSYACLFVGYQEYLISQQYEGPFPHLIKRYIDDIVGATSLPLHQLQDFIDFVCNFHPSLKFTFEITETPLPFLDILLSISDDSISISIYYKDTDAQSFLNYSSSHPIKTKNSIPFSQFLRLRKLCSKDPDFKEKAKEMSSFFVNNGYPSKVINDALQNVLNIPRQEAMKNRRNNQASERIPFTLTYHPLAIPIKNIIYKNYGILSSNAKTRDIFSAPPLMAYRRDSNPRDTLVRSKLHDDNERPGTTACGRSNCRTCDHVSGDTKISTTSGKFSVRQSFTCSSSCLIYCIRCTRCQVLYIGETCRQLNNRFGEHLRNVENKTHEKEQKIEHADTNVSRHFNSEGHSTGDMVVLGLLFADQDNRKRKTLEKRLIFKLGTLIPNGLNKRFSFIS